MGKRAFDVCVSLLVLVVFSPLLLLICYLVIKKIGRPIFFRQSRPGINGQSFELIKFRTMKDIYDEQGRLLPDEERMTKFGSALRRSSLDELPELWNIIKGEMSLVGPRPLLMQYLPLYNKEQSKRHNVRPGITGWAQINGRNAISWKEKFKYDVWYVENRTFFLDLKILFLTFFQVIKKEGISSGTHVTTEAFKGNKNE